MDRDKVAADVQLKLSESVADVVIVCDGVGAGPVPDMHIEVDCDATLLSVAAVALRDSDGNDHVSGCDFVVDADRSAADGDVVAVDDGTGGLREALIETER